MIELLLTEVCTACRGLGLGAPLLRAKRTIVTPLGMFDPNSLRNSCVGIPTVQYVNTEYTGRSCSSFFL